MDSYPSDSSQAAVFVQFIGTPTTVIHLRVSDSVMSERLQKRYNFNDELNSIMNRIQKFHKDTLSLVHKWNGIAIDGEQEPNKVFENIKEALSSEKAFNEVELPYIK